MKRFIWRVFQIGVGIFLAFHVYAVALKFVPVPGTILMAQRGLQGEDIRRDWTRLEEISPYMVQAVMGGEDSRFCEHKGVDFKAIEQALEDNQDGGRRRGGSTITQQTAKNVFFWNGGGYARKAGEAWMASFIDFVWGKRRVMEVYLNVAEWGDGIFGIEAAAQARFGKSAAALTAQEAALLASVLPSPNKWRVDPPGSYVQGRAKTLRQRMRVISDSRYDSCVTGMATLPQTRRKSPPVKEDPAPEVESPASQNIDPTDEPATDLQSSETDSSEVQVQEPEMETIEITEPEISQPETTPPVAPDSEISGSETKEPETEDAKIETPVLPEVELMEMDSLGAEEKQAKEEQPE